jgi:acetyl esterase/lipase
MKRIYLLLSLITMLASMNAQNYREMKLWPENEAKGAEEAALFIYLPETTDMLAPAVLICPGGGYQGLAMEHEGHDMAKWYVERGFVAIVLKYTMPKGRYELPLRDAEKAISTIRAHASEWKINPNRVGVIGSSAGGHLAASLSTLAADENRPDFAILYYPVISFEDVTHGGSKKNLLGDEVNNPELVAHYTLEQQVDSLTPPTLLLLSDDDKVVLPENSVRYYRALKALNIPATMYIFPIGGHGWGFKESFLYQEESRRLIEKWLGL